MGQQNQHTCALPDGTEIGYSLTDRNNIYRIRFVEPDGRRVERSTGCKTKGEARQSALTIIGTAYLPALVAEPQKATWDIVLAELDRTSDLRPDSIRAYRTAIQALRSTVPNLKGPADVTTALAHRFTDRCAMSVKLPREIIRLG